MHADMHAGKTPTHIKQKQINIKKKLSTSVSDCYGNGFIVALWKGAFPKPSPHVQFLVDC